MMKLVNYHTHTTRCQHATGTDRDYVERAIQEGFSILGFADHSPWPYDKEVFVSNIRMREDELGEYVASLNALKREYQDKIDIKIGLECESFPQYFPWIKEKFAQYELDYLILGNHFNGSEINGLYFGEATKANELYDYVSSLEVAVKTGMFFFIAHPDIVFSNYPVFDHSCEDVSIEICKLAISSGIPLEYNLSGIGKREKGEFSGIGYPCQNFWDIAKEYHPKIIVGLDAHTPQRIDGAFLKEETEKLIAQGFNIKTF
jgi:histidinol-phosphatase (PHP family)